MSENEDARAQRSIVRALIELMGLVRYIVGAPRRAWRLAALIAVVASVLKSDVTTLDLLGWLAGMR